MNYPLRKICFLLATSCCVNAYSTPTQDFMNATSQYLATHFVGSLSVGPAWGNGGDAQTLVLAPDIVKTYTINRSTKTLLDGELFAGVNQLLYPNLISQIGLAIAATTYTSVNGDIWDDAAPQFNNYTYHYQLRHTHLAVKGKLLADRGYFFIPWISLSMGVGFNTATSFTNSPLLPEAIGMPNFASHTTTAFTYTLGVGAQRQLNPHWQAGVGYEFTDWGRSQLGTASGQSSSNTLSLSHYYTSGILANLTYSA